MRRAVEFNKYKVTRYAYQKLQYCTKCERYTSIGKGSCIECGSKLISIDRQFDSTLTMRSQIDHMIIFMLFLVGLIFAKNITEIYIMIIVSIGLCIALLIIQRIFKKSEEAHIMLMFFTKQYINILKGLNSDIALVKKKMESDNFKDAYEDLREIGTFLKKDSIKIGKLICLNKFVMRKDAELELESLVLSYYEPILIDYINEVVKLNRNLVKRNVIEYIIANEKSIVTRTDGADFMGSVAGAAIRTRQNVKLYKNFISRYVSSIKKDRLLRLYRLLKEDHSDGLDDLFNEIQTLIKKNYDADPDFMELLS